jgi:hypothetical protein
MAKGFNTLCMCSHAQTLLLFRIEEILQSIICVLCVFVLLPLPRLLSAFAGRHLPEGILWTVDWLPYYAAAGCLPDCGSSLTGCGGLHQDERPKELISVFCSLPAGH